ncbi:hypothetical protein KQI84_14045 [bacterium]|nr:hypothetical protein [bacterium]
MPIYKHSRLFRGLAIVAICLAVPLFALDVVGLFTSLRNPQIYQDATVGFENDITLTPEQVHTEIDAPFTDRKEYARRVTMAVNQGIAHYWRDEGLSKYNLRVPPTENYLLWLASFVVPAKFQKYEFTDTDKAIERGIGLCSQQAIIVTNALHARGIPVHIVGLAGHVVATAQVDAEKDEWWVLDPDFGVVIPHSMEEIEHDPEIIRPIYEATGIRPDRIDVVIGIFGPDGNEITPGYGTFLYDRDKTIIEHASYLAIWLIPLMLVLFGGAVLRLSRRAP